MKREGRMVVSHVPRPGDNACDGHYYAQKISLTRVMNMEDERKAIERFANGRRYWNPFEKPIRGSSVKVYHVFRGIFVNGKYAGRASTYHPWLVEVEA